jgi:hypothetical protein
MIACDRCGEWYHFSCINLPEPDSSDEEETDDVVQQECEPSGDFVCPQCKDLARDRQTAGAGSMNAEYRFESFPLPFFLYFSSKFVFLRSYSMIGLSGDCSAAPRLT